MATLACVSASAVVLDRLGFPDEQWSRAARLREQDRRDFLAARQLAVAVARRLTGRPWSAADLRQRCDTCGGTDHGRPSLGELSLSWSHAVGTVAAVVSDEAQVAIDLQPRPDFAAVREVLAAVDLPVDADPVSVWVVRECLVKLGIVSLSEAVALSEADLGSATASQSVTWTDLASDTRVAVGSIRTSLRATVPPPEIVDISSLASAR